MTIQSSIASNSGFTPTCFTVLSDRLAPMKKRVSTNPFFASQTSESLTEWLRPQYVLITIARIKRNINQGMDILLVLSRKMNIVTNASGIIHNARVSLIRVANFSASGPYASPAPTTDDVSWIAIAAHVPNCCCYTVAEIKWHAKN